MSGRVCEHCNGNGSKEHRAALCHLVCVKFGDNATTTHGKLQQVFGNDAMSRVQAFLWHKMFSEGRSVVEDEQHNGRPLSTRTGDNTARVKVKVNQSHYRSKVPRGFQEVTVPRLRDNDPEWW